MTMRILALAAALLFAVVALAAHPDPELAGALEAVSKDQIAAFNREDLAATMGYAHTRSPSYDETQAELNALFADVDPKAEQVSFQYVGHDDEFAMARVKVKVTADAEGFDDVLVDTLTIFHQEGGKWKIWDAYLFGGQLVD